MTITKLRLSIHDRLARLEQRADGHDKMAPQVNEMYLVFDGARKVFAALNRLSVKISAAALGVLGALATVLTVIEKAGQLLGHH